MVTIEEMLTVLVERGGSDLHISVGSPPRIRVEGDLINTDFEVLTPETTQKLLYGLLNTNQIAKFEKELELDISFGIERLGRFRTNIFKQRGTLGSVMRLIPYEIKTMEQLRLPVKICQELCNTLKGLVLVTGSTGSGKSTTLAAMIDYINSTSKGHVITIEDPVEFLHKHKKCLVNQREIGTDTFGFGSSLKRVLRQDPDVVLIGEMRDLETTEAALTISETGHLVFGTLHTSDCVQTINRIIDIFPSHQQQQIRTQLSFTIQGVFCQQLLPRSEGRGRVLAAEIMLATPAIRALIRDSKIHQIYSLLQTGGKLGMRTMNQDLTELYKNRQITYETALSFTADPDDFKRVVEKSQ